MRTEGVEIVGLGTANLPLLSFLPSLGVGRISVRDCRPPSGATAAHLSALGAEVHLGDGYLTAPLSGVIFRAPGIRPDLPALCEARRRGGIVLTEVALLLALTPADIFAVTGSDGKTTTAMMTAAILRRAGRRVLLGGNIGIPLLSALPEMRTGDALVLELSSFQLCDMDAPCGRVAVTSLSENHLDWHTDMGEYLAAKARILGSSPAVIQESPYAARLCRTGDILVGGAGIPSVTVRGGVAVLTEEGGSRPLLSADLPSLPGAHNLKNAMTAAALTADIAGREAIEAALLRFVPAPHRCTYLGRYRGVHCYDASIDTTPARTLTTLASFKSPPVVILGGRNKGLSYAPLAEALPRLARAAVLMGESGDEMRGALAYAPIPCLRAATMAEAVALAFSLAEVGGSLLLSPAAASFDLYPDYRARGEDFAALCRMQK